jgi:hypothetical protein
MRRGRSVFPATYADDSRRMAQSDKHLSHSFDQELYLGLRAAHSSSSCTISRKAAPNSVREYSTRWGNVRIDPARYELVPLKSAELLAQHSLGNLWDEALQI